MFLLCAYKNIWQVNDTMKENMTEISHREIFSTIVASLPKALNIGPVKMNTGRRQREHPNKTNQDLWRYTPSMCYCLAPNDWPQRVLSALAIPNCQYIYLDHQ